jgi:hypothetical protein
LDGWRVFPVLPRGPFLGFVDAAAESVYVQMTIDEAEALRLAGLLLERWRLARVASGES